MCVQLNDLARYHTHPAGTLARRLAPASFRQPLTSATTPKHRELLRQQSNLQDTNVYPRPQAQHDLQTPGRNEMRNKDHTPLETPPTPTATSLTIRPNLLHYINSGLAWFAETFRRPRHKGYARLGDAFTTRPSEQPRPQPPLTHTPRGWASPPPPSPPAHGWARGHPCACPGARPRALLYPRPGLRVRLPHTVRARYPRWTGLPLGPYQGMSLSCLRI